jgi:hypothetical protein
VEEILAECPERRCLEEGELACPGVHASPDLRSTNMRVHIDVPAPLQADRRSQTTENLLRRSAALTRATANEFEQTLALHLRVERMRQRLRTSVERITGATFPKPEASRNLPTQIVNVVPRQANHLGMWNAFARSAGRMVAIFTKFGASLRH